MSQNDLIFPDASARRVKNKTFKQQKVEFLIYGHFHCKNEMKHVLLRLFAEKRNETDICTQNILISP